MSGKTAVGTEDAVFGHDGTDDEPTLADLVVETLEGAEPTAIVYRENTGTLEETDEEWHRYEGVAALPETPVDGWDELYVYTETHVYRWLGVGFDAGPERLPRDPETLPAGD